MIPGQVRSGTPVEQDAVRRLTTGVTVLTVADGQSVHGATVSAVSLVARDPLIVCAGLRTGSVLSGLALDSGRFAVNVLSERQALVADWFANPARPGGREQFALVGWRQHPETGIPLLDNTLAVLLCRVHRHVPAGDHELLLGEVDEATVGVGSPLVSFDGALYGAEFRDVARHRGWRNVTTVATTTLD
ncbi:MAG TPA: flavin reductase family protein [Pseudonocardiaceae bacterium]|nr:flavin reductase family protein [Pseudonocardiaceae bacterium]